MADNGKRFGDAEFVLEPCKDAVRLLVGPRIGITRAADLLLKDIDDVLAAGVSYKDTGSA